MKLVMQNLLAPLSAFTPFLVPLRRDVGLISSYSQELKVGDFAAQAGTWLTIGDGLHHQELDSQEMTRPNIWVPDGVSMCFFLGTERLIYTTIIGTGVVPSMGHEPVAADVNRCDLDLGGLFTQQFQDVKPC